jgi:hypothetical protein
MSNVVGFDDVFVVGAANVELMSKLDISIRLTVCKNILLLACLSTIDE